MNINCDNCKEILSKYLSDLPIKWRNQIVTTICEAMNIPPCRDCGDFQKCETITSLSAFSKKGCKISVTYKDENGKESKKTFDFCNLLTSSLNDVDPKCIATQQEWNNWTFLERMQAIVSFDCNCCTTTTSSSTTTTTTAKPDNTFILNNFTFYEENFTVTFKETLGVEYVKDVITSAGNSSYYDYSGSLTPSNIIITHVPDVFVGVGVTVNGVFFGNFDNTSGTISINDVPPRSDVIVTLTSEEIPSLPTQQRTTKAPTTYTTEPPTTSTTTSTTARVRNTTTTTTTLPPACADILLVSMSVATTTTAAPTTTTTTTSSSTTNTTTSPQSTTSTTTVQNTTGCPAVIDIEWSRVN